MRQHASWGLTLIELLTVMSIIGILAVFVVTTLTESTAQSRDAERQADLRTMQTAIELYRQENGRYPEGCNGAGNWSGERGSDYECATSGEQYIVGIAPKYIRTLPSDPRPQANDSGYAYIVDGPGTVYKLIVFKTVEELQTYDGSSFNEQLRAFHICDANDVTTPDGALCAAVNSVGNNLPAHCRRNSEEFRTSYAVWGGYDQTVYPTLTALRQERATEDITCSIP